MHWIGTKSWLILVRQLHWIILALFFQSIIQTHLIKWKKTLWANITDFCHMNNFSAIHYFIENIWLIFRRKQKKYLAYLNDVNCANIGEYGFNKNLFLKMRYSLFQQKRFTFQWSLWIFLSLFPMLKNQTASKIQEQF
jgi:hypothetical protein